MNVLFVASEMTPIAKVGGLGDVIGSLPKALRKIGVDASVIIPRYAQVPRRGLRLVRRVDSKTALFRTTVDGAPVFLIENAEHLSRGPIYADRSAFAKNGREITRFDFFSRMVFELLASGALKTDIVHCNDWHTGALVRALENHTPPPFTSHLSPPASHFSPPKVVFTIHNLANQGMSGGRNRMADGIAHADFVTTVSPTYAKEILTKEYGGGLEAFLRRRAREHKLVGILNGIDYDFWNPETDPFIRKPYGAKQLDLKFANKAALAKELKLSSVEAPLCGMVARLTNQKGVDLILNAIKPFLSDGVQFAFLGQGANEHEIALARLARRYPAQVSATIGFNEPLAHRIYAGSDFFLMPSRFEPCGLGQMIAMRYGTVPVVRKTGGLADTVTHKKTGFVFRDASTPEFGRALETALRAYRETPPAFRQIQRSGIRADFSFAKSGRRYLTLYRKLLKNS